MVALAWLIVCTNYPLIFEPFELQDSTRFMVNLLFKGEKKKKVFHKNPPLIKNFIAYFACCYNRSVIGLTNIKALKFFYHRHTTFPEYSGFPEQKI